MAVDKICRNCGIGYSVRNYRVSTSYYCSYRCAAQFKKVKQYEHTHIKVEKKCAFCENIFLVENSARKRERKTCSKVCQNKLQGLHLQQFPKAHFKPIEKRTYDYKKNCVICDKYFEINGKKNSRKQCCSMHCGAKLAARSRALFTTKEQFAEAVKNSKDTYELCDMLKCSIYSIMKLSKHYNIPYKKNNYKIRKDGYHQYSNKKNHRRLYEHINGVKLLPKQGLHHIDGIKLNNEMDNLVLTNDASDHMKIHSSLQKVAFELFRKGSIGFNKETKEYFIK